MSPVALYNAVPKVALNLCGDMFLRGAAVFAYFLTIFWIERTPNLFPCKDINRALASFGSISLFFAITLFLCSKYSSRRSFISLE